jgi:hypothetical protein
MSSDSGSGEAPLPHRLSRRSARLISGQVHEPESERGSRLWDDLLTTYQARKAHVSLSAPASLCGLPAPRTSDVMRSDEHEAKQRRPASANPLSPVTFAGLSGRSFSYRGANGLNRSENHLIASPNRIGSAGSRLEHPEQREAVGSDNQDRSDGRDDRQTRPPDRRPGRTKEEGGGGGEEPTVARSFLGDGDVNVRLRRSGALAEPERVEDRVQGAQGFASADGASHPTSGA